MLSTSHQSSASLRQFSGSFKVKMSFRKYILLIFWTSLQQVVEINSVTNHFIKEDTTKAVDEFIHKYVSEVGRTLRRGINEHIINKRSHSNVDFNQLTGLELLVGFQERYALPSKFPLDLILFSRCLPEKREWYCAALEPQLKGINGLINTTLAIYKYKVEDDLWEETFRVGAASGKSIAVEQVHDDIYIVVAQYLEDKNLGSTVWCLPSDSNTLQYVHMLNTQLASHAIMWTDTYTYAAVAVSENPTGSQKRYATLSPVYQWHGNSFDMIDSLPTHNPQALVQFNIRSSVFVAVANFQNDFGETLIDSEIFRYDLTSGKFTVYQKLPTEAAVDIKSFCFQSDQITENFLVYASAFHTDERGVKDYNSPSVVYKLSDEEYFVPFQALQVSKVTSWLPVRHIKDGVESLTLIGASDEGIISFQYDGWCFVPTGVQYDRSTFGPGPKSLNVFYLDEKAYISVANRHSDGHLMNVFSPVFKYHRGVESLQRIISNWIEEMTEELIDGEAKMNELMRITREAPSENATVVEIGSKVVFSNAEIESLEAVTTEVGNSNTDVQVYNQLLKLKNQLQYMNDTIAELPHIVDQTSLFTKPVYEDIIKDTVDITCTHACHVPELEVTNVNGENLAKFLANTVNTNEDFDFEGEVYFKHLALIEPLDAKIINGHAKENLIDWSKEVFIDQIIKVEGDVLAKGSVDVSETIDGIFLNNFRNEEIVEPEAVSPTRFLKSLNTSQLQLSDGKLSDVDFRNFVLTTLKTYGDQNFTEFQDVSRLEVEEITATDMFKAVSSLLAMSQLKSCKDEDCLEDESTPHEATGKARARGKYIESINLLDDVIIIPRNITMNGTVLVENGFLSAEDFVDVNHEVSAKKLSQFAIPLNQSLITQHFKFKNSLKTLTMNVDTLNSQSLKDFVELEESGIRLSGRKVFHGDVKVEGELDATETINGQYLKNTTELDTKLEFVELENLSVNMLNCANISFGPNKWQNIRVVEDDGTVIMKNLNIEGNVSANHITVRGTMNNYYLEKLLSDTAFNEDRSLIINGSKHCTGEFQIENLTVNPSSKENFHFGAPEHLWRKRLVEANMIQVDKLYYTGKLNGLESSLFGRWLLTEGDQSILGSQTVASVQAVDVAISKSATLNSHNITLLLTQAVLTSDNTTFETAIFEKPVRSSEVLVGGRMSGLEIPTDIVMVDPTVDQLITGNKIFLGSVSAAGDFYTSGLVSDVNITAFCQVLHSNVSNLIITGDGKFKQEPEILTLMNGVDWTNITHAIWFKEESVAIQKKVSLDRVNIEKLELKNLNSNNIEEQLSKLVSLSKDQDISGTFYFMDVEAENGMKAEEAAVGGEVQGIQLSTFVQNVLLNQTDQVIEGVIDFNRILIENGLDSTGLVNGLNISTDVMLMNVASNEMTAELSLEQLNTKTLILPSGSLVAGVDMDKWSKIAITKSGIEHNINGNITVLGPVDSGQCITVENLVNGVPFHQNNIMLPNENQKITGKKVFSSDSDLTIYGLNVQGNLNKINITDFYQQQVTTSDHLRMSGHIQFLAPLYSERVMLPEVYHGHNLSWLDYQLSVPLPWSRYNTQLDNIHNFNELASRCLAGRAYYLKNMSRAEDVEGDVLFTVPLQRGNASVLAVIASQGNNITLSQLSWSDERNTFINMPGSDTYFLRDVPSNVQALTLPGGEHAAYVTGHLAHNKTSSVGQGFLLRLKNGLITQTKVLSGKPGSSLLSFLDYQHRICFVVVDERCKVSCLKDDQRAVRLSTFSCYNITQATLLSTDRGRFILGIQTQPQGSLFLWQMSGTKFTLKSHTPQFNPTSIAATMTTASPHIAVANLHRLGLPDPETITIYRLDENTLQLQLQQVLPALAPSQLVFSSLPSSQSVLYVSSLIPALPLHVYVYRGILGYELLFEDPTLPVPTDLQPFTDHQQRHFLVIPANYSASVLQAEFEGQG